jgi:aerobic carbon-monoxide dehydrogenase medium subunit
MYNFEYLKPRSIDEAVAALQDEDAVPIAGGQTLIPTLKARLAQPSKLVDLLGALSREISMDRGGAVHIGAAARHHAIETSDATRAIPGLQGLAARIGDPQVRNRGTIGGSIANNDPAACYPAAALALGAEIVTNARTVPASDFFQGMFTTALEEGEIVTEIVFPSVNGNSGRGDQSLGRLQKGAYGKFPQPASRFPLVGVFVAKFENGARVAVTGASESGVFRWAEAEQALGANFSADAIKDLTHAADGMIGDIHGSPEYRAHLIGVMTRRAVAAAG